jgi:N-acetyl-anhydromuramyl-L-alanine amidase AmpD
MTRKDIYDARNALTRRGFISLAASLPVAGLLCPARAEPIDFPALASSGPNYEIDTSIPSRNQDARARTLVLHYTASSLATALRLLTEQAYAVSAHYLVPDGAQAAHVYGLVPETRRAWHAGVSQWQGVNQLNYSSIGIEIVNLGFPSEDGSVPAMQRRWYPYDNAQIDVVGQLARDIGDRHAIAPHRVVGHSDIAPGRKSDPGPLFPWRYLHIRHGVGAWPDEQLVAENLRRASYDGDIAGLQRKLKRYGYSINESGVLDKQTMDVIVSFQMHFRPARYDGIVDAETVAILDALLAKYFPAPPMLHSQWSALEGEASLDERGDGAWD